MLSVAKTRLGVFQSQSQNIKEHSVRIVSTAFLLFFLITSPVRAAINGVAAVVNGEMITAFDLQAETAPEAMRRGLNPKDPNQAAAIEELTKATLERMINNIILTQEAQRLKISVGDSEVDIATARNAHLPCFSVDWGTRTREVLEAHGAVSISHTPEELLRALSGV